MQTAAQPTDDGQTYVLNGSKRYITNGAIADVLTVMARTPDPRGGDSKVTAFLVTPDMPGFEVVEARMPKCGIRGTATARLAFHDMPRARLQYPGPAWQRFEGRADRPRLRPHHVWRQLHGRRQGLSGRGHPPRRNAAASSASRSPTSR